MFSGPRRTMIGGVGLWMVMMWAAAPLAWGQVLRLPALAERPLLWPERIRLQEELSDGVSTWAQGTTLRVHSVQQDGVVVFTPQGDELTLLPAEATDLLEQASNVQQQLPEEARDVTLHRLVDRGEWLPKEVQLTESLAMPEGRSYPVGKTLVPIRLEQVGGEVALAAVDPASVAEGVLKERFHYPLASTDLIPRMRAGLLEKAPGVGRVVAELADRLVDAEGRPVAAPAVAPRYFVIYHGAGSCGWCSQFAPELAAFYRDVVSTRNDVQLVLLSRDDSPEQMQAYMKRDAMPWPAIAFDQRSRTPFLLGLTQGGTPHLFVVTAEGRIIHDGLPAGERGAKAAITAFTRELQRLGANMP